MHRNPYENAIYFRFITCVLERMLDGDAAQDASTSHFLRSRVDQLWMLKIQLLGIYGGRAGEYHATVLCATRMREERGPEMVRELSNSMWPCTFLR